MDGDPISRGLVKTQDTTIAAPVDIQTVKEVLDSVSHPLRAVHIVQLEHCLGHLRYNVKVPPP